MAIIPEREIEESALGGRITRDGYTVVVHIYRFADTDENWTLEVVDHEGGSTVWEETFVDDQDAYDAFERTVVEDGIKSFSKDQPVRH